jgi:hypothetical protein
MYTRINFDLAWAWDANVIFSETNVIELFWKMISIIFQINFSEVWNDKSNLCFKRNFLLFGIPILRSYCSPRFLFCWEFSSRGNRFTFITGWRGWTLYFILAFSSLSEVFLPLLLFQLDQSPVSSFLLSRLMSLLFLLYFLWVPVMRDASNSVVSHIVWGYDRNH